MSYASGMEAAQQRYAGLGEGAAMAQSDRRAIRGGETARQPETMRFLGELEEMLAMCGGSMDALEGRLERVTRSESPATEGSGLNQVPREGAQTQMGSAIQALIERAVTLNVRMARLIQRVEV